MALILERFPGQGIRAQVDIPGYDELLVFGIDKIVDENELRFFAKLPSWANLVHAENEALPNPFEPKNEHGEIFTRLTRFSPVLVKIDGKSSPDDHFEIFFTRVNEKGAARVGFEAPRYVRVVRNERKEVSNG